MPVVTEPQTEASRPSGWQFWPRLAPTRGVLRRVWRAGLSREGMAWQEDGAGLELGITCSVVPHFAGYSIVHLPWATVSKGEQRGQGRAGAGEGCSHAICFQNKHRSDHISLLLKVLSATPSPPGESLSLFSLEWQEPQHSGLLHLPPFSAHSPALLPKPAVRTTLGSTNVSSCTRLFLFQLLPGLPGQHPQLCCHFCGAILTFLSLPAQSSPCSSNIPKLLHADGCFGTCVSAEEGLPSSFLVSGVDFSMSASSWSYPQHCAWPGGALRDGKVRRNYTVATCAEHPLKHARC